MIEFIKNLFKICDHEFELISTSKDNLSIKPNELLIYQCKKCKKLKYSTLEDGIRQK